MGKRKPERPLEELSPEELKARIERDEKLLAEIEGALETMHEFWVSPIWEDAQVVGLKLSDALDDLGDSLRALEKAVSRKRFCKGSVAFERGKLLWTGFQFVYFDGVLQTPLTNTPKAIRMKAVKVLPELLESCQPV